MTANLDVKLYYQFDYDDKDPLNFAFVNQVETKENFRRNALQTLTTLYNIRDKTLYAYGPTSDGSSLTAKQVATDIMKGYKRKFGMKRYFNKSLQKFRILGFDWGDHQYDSIKQVYWNIMADPAFDLKIGTQESTGAVFSLFKITIQNP